MLRRGRSSALEKGPFSLYTLSRSSLGTKKVLFIKMFVNLDKSNCFQAESSTKRRIQLSVLKFQKLLTLLEGSLVFQ